MHVLIFVFKKKGGGLDLLFVLVFSPLSFLQYVSQSIQLTKDLGGLNICYSLYIINTGNYFLLTTGKDALTD